MKETTIKEKFQTKHLLGYVLLLPAVLSSIILFWILMIAPFDPKFIAKLIMIDSPEIFKIPTFLYYMFLYVFLLGVIGAYLLKDKK
jgi:hypothetical protein